MSTEPLPLHPNVCYRALAARDARFDGCFFTGVTTTGIYCRPVCRVRRPRRENCRFFRHAAQAEAAGFRPCLRCRPELAPRTLAWSAQDAGAILARQAAQWLDGLGDGAEVPGTAQLAAHLGISDRHLRRIFAAQFGVAPLQYLQTRRLLTAKQLLTDTDLPVSQVALTSGFASLRRFNAAFLQHYRLSPTQLRREGASSAAHGRGTTQVRLAYRPPYEVGTMLDFLRQRAIDGVELADGPGGQVQIARTLGLSRGGQRLAGWLGIRFDPVQHQVRLELSDGLRGALPLLIHRVRGWLDLDADPQAIHAVLHADFPHGDGLRVPGTLDGFELAVRAVLGQQVTVAAARTLAGRLVERFGTPVETPWPQLTHLFPTPEVLAGASGDALGRLGIVRQRQAAMVALAQAVADGRLVLHDGADVPATMAALRALPGIGDWTAEYIAMRALRWPDAFPAGDVALQKALGLRGQRQPARAAESRSQAWKPWRSYAVIRAWAAPPTKETA